MKCNHPFECREPWMHGFQPLKPGMGEAERRHRAFKGRCYAELRRLREETPRRGRRS